MDVVGLIVVIGGLVFIFTLMVLGVPLAFSFAIGVLLIVNILGLDALSFLQASFFKMNSFTLIAIPAFIMAGNIMNKAGIAEQILEFFNLFLGAVKGRTGIATVLGETFFGACSGSASAATAVFTTVMTPKMTAEGYSENYATAIVASSSMLAMLIPPSCAMIIYGFMTGTAISTCFMAAAVPGLLIAFAYILIHTFLVRNMRIQVVKTSLKQRVVLMARGGYKTIFALLAPFFILGSIYGGFATPTEAGAIAVLYSILVGFFVFKKLSLKVVYDSLAETATVCGVIGILITFVLMMGRLFTLYGIGELFAVIAQTMPNKWMVLLMINLILLFMGMIMDELSVKVLAIPVLFPVVLSIGVHPVHFAAIMVLNTGLGTTTPPVGTNVYMASSVAGVPASRIFPYVLKFFFFGGLPVLALTTYIPKLSLWLPSAMGLLQ